MSITKRINFLAALTVHRTHIHITNQLTEHSHTRTLLAFFLLMNKNELSSFCFIYQQKICFISKNKCFFFRFFNYKQLARLCQKMDAFAWVMATNKIIIFNVVIFFSSNYFCCFENSLGFHTCCHIYECNFILTLFIHI